MHNNKKEQKKKTLKNKNLKDNLGMQPIFGSSTDYEDQNIFNVMPDKKGIWSSSGFYEINSFDYIVIALGKNKKSSVCLVEEIILEVIILLFLIYFYFFFFK